MGKIETPTQDGLQASDLSDKHIPNAGELLRRAREHYGLSIPDVEQHLHIRRSYIEAIETGDVDILPGRVYAIGFVRSYAEFLGLDGSDVIKLFKVQLNDKASLAELHFPAEASESKIPNFYIIAASFVLLIAFISAFIFVQNKPQPSEIQEPELSITDLEINQISFDPDQQAALFGAIEPAAGFIDPIHKPIKAPRIIIHAEQSTYVEIFDQNGEALISQVIMAGDSFQVPDEDGLIFNTGNPAGLYFTLDGQPLRIPGQEGENLQNFGLTPDILVNYLKKVEN